MSFILNTKTGILHTKECADGLNGLPAVEAGFRKPYPSIENAMSDPKYKHNHDHPYCLGR